MRKHPEMGWYVYTSIPFSSFTSAYIELKPSREQRDARSTNIDRDLVGVFANGKGDSGKAILGWSIARCGNLLSFYSLILEPGPGSPSDDVEDGVSLLEYKLPSAAIGGPIMIGQHNEGLYCAAILCEDLSLSTFDIRMTQRGLLATSTESIITHDLRKELRTLEFDKHSIENDLLVCPCDSNCGFIAKNDGSIFALSYSKKLVANFEKPEMKLRRITGGLSSWRISPEMIKNCTTPVKPDFSSAKLLGLGVIPLENYYFLVCAFEKLLFLIDVRRERVRCCVDFSNICDKGLSLYGVTLSNTDYPVKCFKGASEVFVFIHVKSSNRSEGLLVYSVKTGLLLHPAKKDSLYPFELASFLDFPDAFNASSGAKLLDFECLSLHKGSKTASYHVLCLLKTELCQMIALAELEFKIPTVVSWKEISLGNLHPEGFCSRLKNLSTDEALDVVFDGSVEYPILREAVLDFVEQGNAQKSFIDFTYSLEKLKSITYYAITNEARRVIFDLYGENYSHTLGNEKLHKTIIDNVAHMFLESIDSQIVRGRTPICIRYDQNSSSILLFGLRSFGVLRDRTHFEYFKLPSSTLELGKTLEHDSISLAKDLSMLVHRVPLTPQTVSAVVKVLLYKEYGGDIQDLFCELAAYSFKDACAIDTQNFISTYSSIPNRDCFFLEIINQVNLTRSNFEHRGGDQPAQKMGSLPLLRAQLAIEVYAQISVAMYETVLDVILTILYAYFVGNRNGIDLRLDSKTLGTAIIQLNNAALHKILSSDNGRIHKEKSNGNSNRSTSTSPQLDEKQHTYSESPRIEPNTDPHAYYDKLNINSSSSLNIYINKPAISRSNLLCLFNSYKCFDSTFSSIMRSNIVHIALQFMHNLKPFFNMAYHLLCSTKDSVILLLELIKLGNNNIVREIVKICTRNPLISYIRGRYASEDGDFNTAKKCFEHFSSYMINSSSSNNPFPIELLCGILPDYIIQSRNPYRYYMHVINDCSTSKHDRRCPSFIIYFANLALSVHNNIQEPRSMHCIKETLLQRMFDSYLEMGDLCGCFDVMAEFSQNFNILHLIQRILRYCTDNKMLGDLISKYPIAPYGELFISEMVKFFRAMSPTDQPGECFKYANSLFSLYIREKDHRRGMQVHFLLVC